MTMNETKLVLINIDLSFKFIYYLFMIKCRNLRFNYHFLVIKQNRK